MNEFIQVPHDRLDCETLNALIESYIMREGTDYGFSEASLEQKVSQIREQVISGEVVITFDPGSQSCNLLPLAEFNKLPSQ